ncbi:putative disease resistance protein [Quercus suber]|uniref:Disease resistance protein n=1 Tax=Quercus suber TaxID=58331 RepID=A0AAW0JX46_QUESU
MVEETFPEFVYEAKNLRFLYLYFMPSQMVQSKLFNYLTCLRTLHLKGWYILELSNEVEKLIHLRYLKLSDLAIEELPESICNLCNLLSLDVSDYRILEKLPQGIGKLINLRHLLLKNGEVGMKSFPKGIGRLTCLKTLQYFPVGKGEEICKLGELEHLNHIQGKLQIVGLSNVVDFGAIENTLKKKKDLLDDFYFSVVFDEKEDVILPVSHEKYAEELLFQEALMCSIYSSVAFDEEEDVILPVSDEKYAELLQFQEEALTLLPLLSSPTPTIQAILPTSEPGPAKEAGESSYSFCEICVERKDSDQMFKTESCVHSFCSDCIGKHVATKIQESITVVTCPGLDCKGVIELDACGAVLPKDVLDRWDEALCFRNTDDLVEVDKIEGSNHEKDDAARFEADEQVEGDF